MNIDTMKYYVESGLWNKERVERLHRAGRITKDEYNTLVDCLNECDVNTTD